MNQSGLEKYSIFMMSLSLMVRGMHDDGKASQTHSGAPGAPGPGKIGARGPALTLCILLHPPLRAVFNPFVVFNF